MAALGSVASTIGEANSLQRLRYQRLAKSSFVSKTNEFGFSHKLRIRATHSSESPLQSNSEIVRPILNNLDTRQDIFLDYFPENEIQAKEQEHELLRVEIRRELLKTAGKPLEFLKLVDTLEQLGVAYHFEKIIDETLRHIYNTDKEHIREENNLDLYHTSLMFRMLRQHGYYVASNVFEKFMDKQGNFLTTLKDDAESMLSLYEATHVREHGEDILEKALHFSKNHLKDIVDVTQTMDSFTSRILRALKYPIQKSVTRLESRNFISFYEQDRFHNKSMLRFAKLDYNILQSMYKEEIKELIGWMQSFGFEKKFPFARPRPVECHFFSVETYFQPNFSTARKIYSKTFIMLTILDDIYDGFGTIEELGAFTKAIKRWDKGCIDQLSGYMREFYEILYDTFEDFENEMDKVGRKNYIEYLRNEMINLSQAYMQEESKWRQGNYVPTYEEFLENAFKTSAINMVMALSLLENEVEESIAKKSFENVSKYGKIQRVAFIIGRFMNDMCDYEFDRQTKRVAGAVNCYMKQYDVSKEDACVALNVVVEDAWKDLAEEICRPTTLFPVSLITRVHNFCRVCHYIFKYENAYTTATLRMKTTFKLLFVEPVF